MNFKTILSQSQKFISKRSPELLIAFGIAGMASAIYFAIKETPKAMQVIEEKEDEKGEPLTTLEKAKAVAPVYAPTIASAAIGATLIICSNRISNKRNAALAAVASITDTTLKNYREAVAKKLGAEEEKEIQKEAQVMQARSANEVPKSKILNSPCGSETTWCYDPLIDRYFYSSRNAIERAVNEFNRQMRYENRLSCNEWYDMLGLNHASLAENVGWDIDMNGYLDISWSSKLDENGSPTLVLVYSNPPKHLEW